jgi:uncharacterized membrane protein YphA (DoxX/SURF4 family)
VPPAVEAARAPAAQRLQPLALVRVAIGGLFLARTTPLAILIFGPVGGDARPLLGWPAGDTAGLGIGLSPIAVKIACVARTLGLVAFTLGIHARWAALVAVTSGYVVLYQAPFAFTSTQYLLLQATLLLGLADTSTALAVRPEPARSPTSSRWMLRAFVASVYLWAAFAKLRPDWLDGRTLAQFYEERRLAGPLADWLISTPRRCAVAGPAVALGELALGPLLLYGRTRRIGLILAVSFHLGIQWMGHPDVIGWTMLCLLVVFVDRQRTQTADSTGQTTSP